MALMINGARVEWAGYLFGVMMPDGHVWECVDYNAAVDLASMNLGSSVVMRALYQTDWMETTVDENSKH